MHGLGRARLRSAIAAKRVLQVHRGWYVDATVWEGWYPESRHLATSLAVDRSLQAVSIALSHTSAGVVHRLPLFKLRPQRVHVSGPKTNGYVSTAGGVARHAVSIEDQCEVVHGIRVTTLARTVADVVGSVPLAAAVVFADAALRKIAWDDTERTYDEAAAEEFREGVLACRSLSRGARGCVQGRWVVAFADGRVHLPGESVSRLYLHQLGFAPPRLQVPITHGNGTYYVDFGLDDVNAWGEFDGTGKYTDPEMLKDKSTAEAVLEEKWREDEIRGITGRAVYRWGSKHTATIEDFRRRLAGFGLYPAGAPGAAPRSFRTKL